MPSAAMLVATAEKWTGYLEKRSNAQLDDFTANAGANNYTCFNRDYSTYTGVKLQPAQWCGTFVSCMFVQAFGLERAKKLLCGGLHHYTPTGAQYFKTAGRYRKRGTYTPKPGDVIFFWSESKGRIGHVGIVRFVRTGRVHTVEGNTSGANALVTNGGGVRQKSYALTSTYIDGYGAVNYDDTPIDQGGFTVNFKTIRKGDADPKDAAVADVTTCQRLLLGWGYALPKYGADGDFGTETQKAVKAFQLARLGKGEDDGIVGPKTWAALFGK